MSLLCSVECGCVSSDGVRGVRASAVAEQLLVSRESGQVQVLNFAGGGLCVRSWQLNNITCPAVQHPISKVYWAVLNDKELVTWTNAETSIPQSTQTFSTSVHTLLVTRSNSAPLVVLSNGTVCVAGEETKPRKSKQRTEVKFADVLECADGACVVCSCDDVLRVDVWAVDCEGVRIVTTAILEETDLTSFCTSQHKLLAAGRDGCLHSWTLTPQVAQCKSVSLDSRPTRLQLSALSNYFVTFTGVSLLLWEPMYMTKQAEISVSGVAMVYACDEWVCGVGDAVRAWRVNNAATGLVGAMDKTVSSPPITMATWGVPSTGSDSINKLLNPKQTPTLDAFLVAFDECTLTSDLCYSAVIERVLNERVFWADTVLTKLLRERLVPECFADQLLTVVLAHTDWEVLKVCLEVLSGYSEQAIVQTVRLLLSGLLLCQPFNDALLQQPLSQLTPLLVRELVEFVTSQLTLPSLLSQAPPTYNAILDWAGQVLDVHFTQLTFDPVARDVLVLLQRAVRDQVLCYSRLACVRGALDAITMLTSHSTSNSTSNGWLYRVETMDIDL